MMCTSLWSFVECCKFCSAVLFKDKREQILHFRIYIFEFLHALVFIFRHVYSKF